MEDQKEKKTEGKPVTDQDEYCVCGCDMQYTMDVVCAACGKKIILW